MDGGGGWTTVGKDGKPARWRSATPSQQPPPPPPHRDRDRDRDRDRGERSSGDFNALIDQAYKQHKSKSKAPKCPPKAPQQNPWGAPQQNPLGRICESISTSSANQPPEPKLLEVPPSFIRWASFYLHSDLSPLDFAVSVGGVNLVELWQAGIVTGRVEHCVNSHGFIFSLACIISHMDLQGYLNSLKTEGKLSSICKSIGVWRPNEAHRKLLIAILNGLSGYYMIYRYHGRLDDTTNFLVTVGVDGNVDVKVKLPPATDDLQHFSSALLTKDLNDLRNLFFGIILPPMEKVNPRDDDPYPYNFYVHYPKWVYDVSSGQQVLSSPDVLNQGYLEDYVQFFRELGGTVIRTTQLGLSPKETQEQRKLATMSRKSAGQILYNLSTLANSTCLWHWRDRMFYSAKVHHRHRTTQRGLSTGPFHPTTISDYMSAYFFPTDDSWKAYEELRRRSTHHNAAIPFGSAITDEVLWNVLKDPDYPEIPETGWGFVAFNYAFNKHYSDEEKQKDDKVKMGGKQRRWIKSDDGHRYWYKYLSDPKWLEGEYAEVKMSVDFPLYVDGMSKAAEKCKGMKL